MGLKLLAVRHHLRRQGHAAALGHDTKIVSRLGCAPLPGVHVHGENKLRHMLKVTSISPLAEASALEVATDEGDACFSRVAKLCRGAGMAGENAFLWKPDNLEQKFVAPHLFGMLCIENIAGHRKPIDMSGASPPHEVKLEVFIRNSDPTK